MKHILIVGAGPVGLTCAIELARRQHHVTLIEQKAAREHISKAIGINALSLRLFETADVTPRLIAAGLALHTMHMHYAHKEVVVDFNNYPNRYNFILALPQDQTEAILEDRLNELGVTVQRQTTLLNLTQQPDAVSVQLDIAGEQQEIEYDYVIGTDGAHSIVRKLLDLAFEGKTYPERWSLADVRMDWCYDNSSGHGFIGAPGQVGVVIPMGGNRYRLVANHPDPFSILPTPYTVHETLWQSNFSIGCRLVKNYQQGRVFLAGDAAHIHSPVGGRGMNLGIEDACVLARLLHEDRAQDYNSLRRPVGKKVVRMTNVLYQILTLKNSLAIQCRNHLLFPLLRSRWLQKKQIAAIVGGSN